MKLEEFVDQQGVRHVMVHYSVKDATGSERLACSPDLADLAGSPTRPAPRHRSGEARAVNCPQCKETKAYREALDQELRRG